MASTAIAEAKTTLPEEPYGKNEELHHHFRGFLSVASVGSLSSIGRSRPVWATYKSDELTESGLIVLHNVPSARLAVLNYVGLLVHEGVHLFLCQMETSDAYTDSSQIETAVDNFSSIFRTKVESGDIGWQKAILNWSADLLAQISQRNGGRRSTTNAGLTDLLRLYTSCRCSHNVAQLLNTCLSSLLETDPEGCVSLLVESAKFGSHFDWVLSFAGTAFPHTIVQHLLSVGLDDFNNHIQKMVSEQRSLAVSQARQIEDNYRVKFRSLSAILSHLARQRSGELKEQLRRIILKSLSSSETQSKDSHVFSFIFKLLTYCQDVLHVMADELYDLLNLKNILLAAKQIESIPKHFVIGDEPRYTNYLIKFVMHLQPRSLVKIFDQLLPVAFEDFQVDPVDNDLAWRAKAQARCVVELILGNVSRHVHNQQISRGSDDLFLIQYVQQQSFRYVDNLFMQNNFGQKYNFRLLTIVATALGEEETAELLIKILLKADSNVQLAVFPAFCSVLRPFYPKLLISVVRKFSSCRRLFCRDGDMATKWLTNIHSLICWEKRAQGGEYKMMNLCDAVIENYGSFITDLLSYAIVSSVSEALKVVQILVTIGSPPLQMPRFTLKIVMGFVQIMLLALKHADVDDGLQLYRVTSEFVLRFLDSQTSVSREAFLASLFDRAFEEYEGLFSMSISSTVDAKDKAKSLISENQSLKCTKTAASLVHSGIIGKGARKVVIQNIVKLPFLRRLLFVDFVGNYCQQCDRQPLTNSPKAVVYNLDQCRQMCTALTEKLCPDAISARHFWEDWDLEKNNVSRFLIVFRRVEDISFAWDLLLLAAETELCLWFCIPIVKAVLGTVLIQCENSVLKNVPMPKKTVFLLNKWFLLVSKGKLLPERFSLMIEVLPLVSQHEASALLLDLWKYFQKTTPEVKMLRQNLEYLQLKLYDRVEPLQIDPEPYMETCRLIMQANIAKFGFLFPKLFPNSLK